MEQLIFTGHSAGGQLTNRYTASSPIFDVLCEDFGVSSKSIIANPGSYVYFSPYRRVDGELDTFEIPSGCDEYNEYSYGLEDLYIYHSRSGENQMREWYRTREIIYLNGSDDNNPNASTLPSSCRARLQGSNRLEKGVIYFNHMIDTYGADINQTQRMIVVPDVGHNNFDMYNSDEGLQELFDTPFLNSCGLTSSVKNLINRDISIYPNPVTGLLNIESLKDLSQPYSIMIIDIFGKVVLQKHDLKASSSIDIRSLEKGAYIIQVRAEKYIGSQRFIKM